MKKIALLGSGYGRGIINLIKKRYKLRHNLYLIIAPNDSEVLFKLAKKEGIFLKTINNNLSLTKKNELVLEIMENYKIDYLFLVGCNFRIKKNIIQKYKNSIFNIHPSLLPSFRGLNAIQQAIEYGVVFSGITIHFIDERFDNGKIISQIPIKIKDLNFEEIDNLFVKEGLNLSIETLNNLP